MRVAFGLLLVLAAAPVARAVPQFGLDVAPKDARVLELERSDPVARVCARAADLLAAQVRAVVGDVSIIRDPARGTVWRGKLLIEREPPLAPPVECDANALRIFEATFDPRRPPAKFPWPYPPQPPLDAPR